SCPVGVCTKSFLAASRPFCGLAIHGQPADSDGSIHLHDRPSPGVASSGIAPHGGDFACAPSPAQRPTSAHDAGIPNKNVAVVGVVGLVGPGLSEGFHTIVRRGAAVGSKPALGITPTGRWLTLTRLKSPPHAASKR